MTTHRNCRPFWREVPPDPQHDVVLLRPATLPVGNRFETKLDAGRYAKLVCECLALSRNRTARAVGRDIQRCRSARHSFRCNRPICPMCARDYRRWVIGEFLRIASSLGSHSTKQIVTVLLAEVAYDDLSQIRLGGAKHRLRKRLDRAGLKRLIAAGGLEVSFKAEKNTFVFHAHLLLIGASETQLSRLRKTSAKDEGSDAFKQQTLQDPPEQLSYLQKFTTYHRPGAQTGPKRAKAYPLKPRYLRPLLQWMNEFQFPEYTFLYGLRRRGTRIMKAERSKEHLA